MLDKGIFKRLAHNDTGAAKGHQGGIVIPKDLGPFFPALNGNVSGANPTNDVRLEVELYINGTFLCTVNTRYQIQTWGGTRSPERRLTDNLGPLRNEAKKDDILLFFNDLTQNNRIQIHLLQQGTALFDEISSSLGTQRWGLIDAENPPISSDNFYAAEKYIDDLSSVDRELFRSDSQLLETTTTRIARDRAFRRRVLKEYDYSCAFTGRKFLTPSGASGLDAAHIIPVNKMGIDHPANGLPLSKELHWAFDRGLIGVDDTRRIIIPESVSSITGNEFLGDLHNSLIREADNTSMRADSEAFRWHREHILVA